MNALEGAKRPLVPGLANVATVKIANYSKRNPDTLFHLQGQAPQSCDSEGHGGVFYDTQRGHKSIWNSRPGNVMSFERKVENKQDKIKKIEEITKKSRASDKKNKKSALKKDMAMENAEMLFDLLHGKQMKD